MNRNIIATFFMDILGGLKKAIKRGIPQMEAEILLFLVTGRSRERIFAHPEVRLAPADFARFELLCKKRAAGVPLAYLTRHKEFFGLDFYVDSRVFIPRPETEVLVEEVLKCHHEHGVIARSGATKQSTICDVGTGSGCIVISLAKKLPNAHFLATDISQDALAVARKNARIHSVFNRIKFIKSDLLKNVLDKPITGIVANLPYIANGDKSVDKEVRKYEPKIALFSGETGLELFDRLFQQIDTRVMLSQPALSSIEGKHQRDNLEWLICEIGFGQKPAINTLIKKHFGNVPVMWKNDLAGIPRVFTINYVR